MQRSVSLNQNTTPVEPVQAGLVTVVPATRTAKSATPNMQPDLAEDQDAAKDVSAAVVEGGAKKVSRKPVVKDVVDRGIDPETGLHVYECARVSALRKSTAEVFECNGRPLLAVESGFACSHLCGYCSVSCTLRRLALWDQLGLDVYAKGYAIVDPTVAKRLPKKLRTLQRLTPEDTIMLSSLSDCWAPLEHRHGIGRDSLKYVLENSSAQVVIRTKSVHVREEFSLMEQYRDRVLFGMSVTGLPEHEAIVKAVEPHASLITERIAAMQEAHDRGLRTQAVFSPLLPGLFTEKRQFDELMAHAIAWGAEQVMAEAVHKRGENFLRCEEFLRRAGFTANADAMKAIDDTQAWAAYSTQLEASLRAAAEKAGVKHFSFE